MLASLKASVMIPMHYFSTFTLNRMVAVMKEKFAVEYSETPSVLVSKMTLPATPKMLVLSGR